VSAGLDYELWREGQAVGAFERDSIRAAAAAIPDPPLISVALVGGELDELWVAQGVRSLARQAYGHWELCAAQFGDRSALADALAAEIPVDATLRTRDDLAGAGDPASALAGALALASGEYMVVLGEGDELAPDALLRVAEAVRSTAADLVYSNEDRIDARGTRSDPVFKPGFSPDRLLCAPYLGRLCAIRSELVRDAGGLDPKLGPAAEHDLLLRVVERADRVAHLPRLLYHRRVLADAERRIVRGLPDPPDPDLTTAVVAEALRRRGERGVARADRESGSTRVIRQPPRGARVSLIARCDGAGTQTRLIGQIERRSELGIDEVFLAGSAPADATGATVVEDRCPSRAANRAAAEATGDVLIFCSPSASIPATAGPRWVGELVAQAMRDEVGAVSGTVIDREGLLLHGGLRVDLEGLAGPATRDLDPEPLGAGRPLNPGGASGELLAIERRRFLAAGGFDSERLPRCLYALDLAFRLEEEGLLSVYTPVAQLQCGDPRPFPSPEEIEHMWARWASRINRLLDYERSPLDPERSPLAPESSPLVSFAAGRTAVPA